MPPKTQQAKFSTEYPSENVFLRAPTTGKVLQSVKNLDSALYRVQSRYNAGLLSDAKFDKAMELAREADKQLREITNQINTLSPRPNRKKPNKAKPAAKPAAKKVEAKKPTPVAKPKVEVVAEEPKKQANA